MFLYTGFLPFARDCPLQGVSLYTGFPLIRDFPLIKIFSLCIGFYLYTGYPFIRDFTFISDLPLYVKDFSKGLPFIRGFAL